MTTFAPGDIVEIKTRGGMVWAQVTHDHPSYPPVVRVFAAPTDARPDDPAAMAEEPVAFTALMQLDAVLARLELPHRVVAHVPVTEPFPTFRMPIRDKQGEVVYWWYWDGRGLRHGTRAEDEAHAHMPLREVMGAAAFDDALRQTIQG